MIKIMHNFSMYHKSSIFAEKIEIIWDKTGLVGISSDPNNNTLKMDIFMRRMNDNSNVLKFYVLDKEIQNNYDEYKTV